MAEIQIDDIKIALRQTKFLASSLRDKLAETPLNPSEDYIEELLDVADMLREKVVIAATYVDLYSTKSNE